MTLDGTIDELRRRLGRYPPERYPVQYATTQFHLGQALLQADRPTEAIGALRTSLRWFPEPLVVERAKVLNLAGAALRATGELGAAAEAFTRAAGVFAERGLAAEHGAALFNLGLVRRDAGEPHAAAELFGEAREQFSEGPVAPQAAAALHQGGALLEAGEVDDAVAALRDAMDLAERVADRETRGAAANTLGLALRAAGRPADAVSAFVLSAAAHPRSVRPAGYAMAKANLALAYEDEGRPERSRLAARQALAVDDVPEPVRAQAEAIVARIGPAAGSPLLAVLDDEPEERWAFTVREEVVRWAVASPAERRAEAAAWVEGQAQRREHSAALNHAWLSALLELPPADLDAVVTAVLEATERLESSVQERFRSDVARTMTLFPVPQLLRLRDRFNALAVGLGQEAAWN